MNRKGRQNIIGSLICVGIFISALVWMKISVDVTMACQVFDQRGTGNFISVPIAVESGHLYKVVLVAESNDSCNDVNGSFSVTFGGEILLQEEVFSSGLEDEDGCSRGHEEAEVIVTPEKNGNVNVILNLLWNNKWHIIAYKDLPFYLDMTSDLILIIYWTLLCSALGAIFLVWSAFKHRGLPKEKSNEYSE